MKALIANNVKSYEVSHAVGYNSSQYFSICFKKHTGCTPTEYKLQHKNYSIKI